MTTGFLARFEERFQRSMRAVQRALGEPRGQRLTPAERQQCEREVEEMLAVAAMQGDAGWKIFAREAEAERAALRDAQDAMPVHQFAGKRGIELRGEIRGLGRLELVLVRIAQRGAAARQRLEGHRQALGKEEEERVVRT